MELEQRMKGGLDDARSTLRGLYDAASQQVAQQRNATAATGTLPAFMRVKADTRALLTYYRDMTSSASQSAVQKPAISIVNATVSASSTKKSGSGSAGVDGLLIDFENDFDIRGVDVATDHQFLLQKMEMLYAVKENTLYKLFNFCLEQVGIDFIVSERKNLPSNLEACSKELPMIFHFFKTFNSLGKKAKLSSLMQTPQDAATEISNQQIQIEQLQLDVQARLSEIFALRRRLDLASLQTERQTTIVKQQDRIDNLEKELEECRKSMMTMNEDYRREVQQKSYIKDQLVVVQTKLETSRTMYEKDIVSVQRKMEDVVQSKQNDLRDMQAMKTDLSMQITRLQQREGRVREMEERQDANSALIKSLQDKINFYAQTTHALEKENARHNRLKIVITAAKVRYHEMALASEKKAAEAIESYREMHGHCVAYATAVTNLQDYARDLEAALKESEDENESLRAKLKFNNADVRSRDLQTTSLRKDMARLEQAAGSSLETSEELDRMRGELDKAKAEIDRMEKQLLTSMQRIYELQGQLLDVQMGPAVGDERLSGDDPKSEYYG